MLPTCGAHIIKDIPQMQKFQMENQNFFKEKDGFCT
jgi:hypothetical protein